MKTEIEVIKIYEPIKDEITLSILSISDYTTSEIREIIQDAFEKAEPPENKSYD